MAGAAPLATPEPAAVSALFGRTVDGAMTGVPPLYEPGAIPPGVFAAFLALAAAQSTALCAALVRPAVGVESRHHGDAAAAEWAIIWGSAIVLALRHASTGGELFGVWAGDSSGDSTSKAYIVDSLGTVVTIAGASASVSTRETGQSDGGVSQMAFHSDPVTAVRAHACAWLPCAAVAAAAHPASARRFAALLRETATVMYAPTSTEGTPAARNDAFGSAFDDAAVVVAIALSADQQPTLTALRDSAAVAIRAAATPRIADDDGGDRDIASWQLRRGAPVTPPTGALRSVAATPAAPKALASIMKESSRRPGVQLPALVAGGAGRTVSLSTRKGPRPLRQSAPVEELAAVFRLMSPVRPNGSGGRDAERSATIAPQQLASPAFAPLLLRRVVQDTAVGATCAHFDGGDGLSAATVDGLRRSVSFCVAAVRVTDVAATNGTVAAGQRDTPALHRLLQRLLASSLAAMARDVIALDRYRRTGGNSRSAELSLQRRLATVLAVVGCALPFIGSTLLARRRSSANARACDVTRDSAAPFRQCDGACCAAARGVLFAAVLNCARAAWTCSLIDDDASTEDAVVAMNAQPATLAWAMLVVVHALVRTTGDGAAVHDLARDLALRERGDVGAPLLLAALTAVASTSDEKGAAPTALSVAIAARKALGRAPSGYDAPFSFDTEAAVALGVHVDHVGDAAELDNNGETPPADDATVQAAFCAALIFAMRTEECEATALTDVPPDSTDDARALLAPVTSTFDASRAAAARVTVALLMSLADGWSAGAQQLAAGGGTRAEGSGHQRGLLDYDVAADVQIALTVLKSALHVIDDGPSAWLAVGSLVASSSGRSAVGVLEASAQLFCTAACRLMRVVHENDGSVASDERRVLPVLLAVASRALLRGSSATSALVSRIAFRVGVVAAAAVSPEQQQMTSSVAQGALGVARAILSAALRADESTDPASPGGAAAAKSGGAVALALSLELVGVLLRGDARRGGEMDAALEALAPPRQATPVSKVGAPSVWDVRAAVVAVASTMRQPYPPKRLVAASAHCTALRLVLGLRGVSTAAWTAAGGLGGCDGSDDGTRDRAAASLLEACGHLAQRLACDGHGAVVQEFEDSLDDDGHGRTVMRYGGNDGGSEGGTPRDDDDRTPDGLCASHVLALRARLAWDQLRVEWWTTAGSPAPMPSTVSQKRRWLAREAATPMSPPHNLRSDGPAAAGRVFLNTLSLVEHFSAAAFTLAASCAEWDLARAVATALVQAYDEVEARLHAAGVEAVATGVSARDLPGAIDSVHRGRELRWADTIGEHSATIEANRRSNTATTVAGASSMRTPHVSSAAESRHSNASGTSSSSTVTVAAALASALAQLWKLAPDEIGRRRSHARAALAFAAAGQRATVIAASADDGVTLPATPIPDDVLDMLRRADDEVQAARRRQPSEHSASKRPRTSSAILVALRAAVAAHAGGFCSASPPVYAAVGGTASSYAQQPVSSELTTPLLQWSVFRCDSFGPEPRAAGDATPTDPFARLIASLGEGELSVVFGPRTPLATAPAWMLEAPGVAATLRATSEHGMCEWTPAAGESVIIGAGSVAADATTLLTSGGDNAETVWRAPIAPCHFYVVPLSGGTCVAQLTSLRTLETRGDTSPWRMVDRPFASGPASSDDSDYFVALHAPTWRRLQRQGDTRFALGKDAPATVVFMSGWAARGTALVAATPAPSRSGSDATRPPRLTELAFSPITGPTLLVAGSKVGDADTDDPDACLDEGWPHEARVRQESPPSPVLRVSVALLDYWGAMLRAPQSRAPTSDGGRDRLAPVAPETPGAASAAFSNLPLRWLTRSCPAVSVAAEPVALSLACAASAAETERRVHAEAARLSSLRLLLAPDIPVPNEIDVAVANGALTYNDALGPLLPTPLPALEFALVPADGTGINDAAAYDGRDEVAVRSRFLEAARAIAGAAVSRLQGVTLPSSLPNRDGDEHDSSSYRSGPALLAAVCPSTREPPPGFRARAPASREGTLTPQLDCFALQWLYAGMPVGSLTSEALLAGRAGATVGVPVPPLLLSAALARWLLGRDSAFGVALGGDAAMIELRPRGLHTASLAVIGARMTANAHDGSTAPPPAPRMAVHIAVAPPGASIQRATSSREDDGRFPAVAVAWSRPGSGPGAAAALVPRLSAASALATVLGAAGLSRGAGGVGGGYAAGLAATRTLLVDWADMRRDWRAKRVTALRREWIREEEALAASGVDTSEHDMPDFAAQMDGSAPPSALHLEAVSHAAFSALVGGLVTLEQLEALPASIMVLLASLGDGSSVDAQRLTNGTRTPALFAGVDAIISPASAPRA